jgi:uncharacterized membrane protein
MWNIVGLAAIGFLISLWFLVKEASCDHGKTEWAVMGFIGYIVIAATVKFPNVTMGLAVITIVVTIWLIIKSFRLRELCVLCILSWFVNIGIIIVAFRH